MIQAGRYDALANSAMAENRPTPETGKLLREQWPTEAAHNDSRKPRDIDRT